MKINDLLTVDPEKRVITAPASLTYQQIYSRVKTLWRLPEMIVHQFPYSTDEDITNSGVLVDTEAVIQVRQIRLATVRLRPEWTIKKEST